MTAEKQPKKLINNKSKSQKKAFKEDEFVVKSDTSDEIIEEPLELMIEDKDIHKISLRRSIRKFSIEKKWKQDGNPNYKDPKGKEKNNILKITRNEGIYSHSSEPRNPFKKAFTAKSIERNVKSRNMTPTPKFTTNLDNDGAKQLDLKDILRADTVMKPKKKKKTPKTPLNNR